MFRAQNNLKERIKQM